MLKGKKMNRDLTFGEGALLMVVIAGLTFAGGWGWLLAWRNEVVMEDLIRELATADRMIAELRASMAAMSGREEF
jgi:hypothetical protein